jgi:3-hydroxybutyryl-CoA dehydrogenase
MKVAVVGAGTMGSGIAQLCATAGHDTRLVDSSSEQLERAVRSVDTSLARFAKKRITTGSSVGDAVTDVDVVVETVVELIDVKQAVFREVVEAAPERALLGTNTSQLSITRIASAVPDAAGRVVGIHFFNPPVLMRLVEVVAGLQSTPESVQRAVEFGTGLGRETVVCLRMLEEGVATAADIDKALRLGFNWPMGPLELGDFNGLDTYLHVLHSLEAQLGERYKPTVTLTNLVAAGRLGRKTGQGIYRYDADGARVAD